MGEKRIRQWVDFSDDDENDLQGSRSSVSKSESHLNNLNNNVLPEPVSNSRKNSRDKCNESILPTGARQLKVKIEVSHIAPLNDNDMDNFCHLLSGI